MKAVDWAVSVFVTSIFTMTIVGTLGVYKAIESTFPSKNETKAYSLGRQDRVNGKDEINNPFNAHSECYDDWQDGWADANDEIVLGGVK